MCRKKNWPVNIINALRALMIKKHTCYFYLTFNILNVGENRFFMSSVGLFAVAKSLSNVLKNNNSCVLNPNTTHEQWFILIVLYFHIFYTISFLNTCNMLLPQCRIIWLVQIAISAFWSISCKNYLYYDVVTFFNIRSIQSKTHLKAFLY